MLKALRYLQTEEKTLDRRSFLKVVSLGAAGFVVGCNTTPPPTKPPVATTSPVATPTPSPLAEAPVELADLNNFVKIGSDNTVTVLIKHAEMGQGVTTGLPTIVAEELDAAWDQVKWEFAPADVTKYNNLAFGVIQGTGGSSSIANSWDQLRQAGASARHMLVEAAAQKWEAKAEDLKVENGKILHPDGREATFGELAEAAASIEPPQEPKLKDPKEFRLIGQDVARLDVADKSDGRAGFSLDVDLPDQMIAVVLRPPKFGAKAKKVDSAEAKKVPGVLEVVEIDRGVAVVAESFWSASKGRDALSVEWDFSEAETRGTKELVAEYKGLMEKPGAETRNDGDVAAALKVGKMVEAEFEFPYLAHAALEPLACTVQVKDGECHLHYGAQLHTVDQGAAARILGLEPGKVFIHSRYSGGSFGRRAVPDSDYVVEAVSIAKALDNGKPVKLVRTREDDMKGGRYRPMSVHKMWGAVNDKGELTAYHHRLAIQGIMTGTPFEQPGVEPTAVEGSSTLPYAIPNLKVEAHIAAVGVPVLWWRSVGHTHNAYVSEVFFDMLAAKAEKDPVELRRQLLKDHPRHLGVLNLAVEKAGPAPEGDRRGRGVAVHESFDSFVAQVADITVDEEGKMTVDRVVCAVDCGIAVNPDIIKAQMESGIIYGLSAALREEITLTEGEVDQGNFDTYQLARMSDAPAIEVHIVPSGNPPTGVGEPGLPPLAPAVANAYYQATGTWITSLPFKRHGIV